MGEQDPPALTFIMLWRDFSYLVLNTSRMSSMSISLRDTMMRIRVLSLVPNPCNGASLVSSPGTANPLRLGRMLGYGVLYWVSLSPKSGESFVGRSEVPRHKSWLHSHSLAW